jgi:hypothetical protein
MRVLAIFLLFGLAAFIGCADPYPPTLKPDYTIRVVPSGTTMVAVPPSCPSWATETTDPYDNQPVPQFGCANARNLAMMAERPSDLVKGRDLDSESGVHAVGTVLRYNNDQTRSLIWTGTDPNQQSTTTMSTATSAITGEVTSPPGSSSASSAASSSSSAAAPAAAP